MIAEDDAMHKLITDERRARLHSSKERQMNELVFKMRAEERERRSDPDGLTRAERILRNEQHRQEAEALHAAGLLQASKLAAERAAQEKAALKVLEEDKRTLLFATQRASRQAELDLRSEAFERSLHVIFLALAVFSFLFSFIVGATE